MTCQNCGHTPAAHIWKDDPERSDCGQPCDCTAYREPEPAVIEDARLRSVHIVPEGEGTGHIEPAVTDLPDAEPAVSVNKGQNDTDLPDAVVEAAAEEQDTEGGSLTDHDRAVLWQALGQCFSTFPNSPESCAMVDAMVEQIVTSHVRAAAASGPWAEHLDAESMTDAERIASGEALARIRAEGDSARADAEAAQRGFREMVVEVKETEAAWLEEANALRAELDNLRGKLTALADEWEQAMGPRVLIDRDGTCDGCGEWKDELVSSYPTPDSEPWLCQECDDDGRREIIELRAIVRGSDDE